MAAWLISDFISLTVCQIYLTVARTLSRCLSEPVILMVLLLLQELRMVKRDWIFLCILLLGKSFLKWKLILLIMLRYYLFD
jgi:hypothetical protein